MKTIYALFLFVVLSNVHCFGQVDSKMQQKKEQIKSLKIAYITNELNLTPEEATKFWPLFNAFEDKQRELRKERMNGYLDRIHNTNDKLSEKEATTLLNQIEATEDEMFQLRKKFVSSLKNILPAVKILKLKKAEEEFSRKLLQQYRDKRGKN
ncbi:sensor of ECF-type sigma factor [Flavobacterium sp. SUN046]|uniref:sensor of ECF-type sigma factor n=1 Tax=Flavobacterium sp. SUN046 TaxID=3002440 RepID=UPI002DBEE529|nr:sensor of ECF-type sigma factor [Flavobacterium sp. SUN046]MEC4048647.1 sensor of ECF-type sigma factor [Flavobacterium sp. SUN046]